MRQVSFKSDMNGEIVSFEFNSIEFTDSKALHILLTENVPFSDDYTVEFKDYTPDCFHTSLYEIGMAGYWGHTIDCGFGCKVYACFKCGLKEVQHNSTYGCTQSN